MRRDHQLSAAERPGLSSPHKRTDARHRPGDGRNPEPCRQILRPRTAEQSADNSPASLSKGHAPRVGIPERHRSACPWRSNRRLRHRHEPGVAQISYQLKNGPGIAKSGSTTRFRQNRLACSSPSKTSGHPASPPSTEAGQRLHLLPNSRFGVSPAVKQLLETDQEAIQSTW